MDKGRVEENELHLVSTTNNLLDSRTSHLDDVLNEKLEEALHNEAKHITLHEVAKIANEYDPIDLAFAVSRLPQNSRIIVYDKLPDLNAKTIFMIHTGKSTRSAIFKQIDDDQITKLIGNMPPDEAVWILDDMSDRRLKRILDKLDSKKASRIKELQKHDRSSAGRLMTNEFFSFHYNTTIGEIAKAIRENPGIDLTRRIFVINDEGALSGFVSERNLIVNPSYTPIRQVMRPVLQKVTAETSRDEVVDIVERYQIPALPVVDENDKLVGVINYEDVVEAMEDIADETLASIAGTGEDISEHEPIFRRFYCRLPWLFVTLCSGLLSAALMAHFSDQVWFFIFLPFFIPLITGMSGNVGIQCSTVLVRGMSTGEISAGSKRLAIKNELLIGLLIGCSSGLFVALLVLLLNSLSLLSTDPFILGVTISCGLMAACLTATCLGTFSPFFFARLQIDPAIAAGPIVTAFNDILSSLMFFFTAHVVYLIVTRGLF